MAFDMSQTAARKSVELVVVGERMKPSQAHEIIRRTDLVFKQLTYYRVSGYGHAVRKLLGFPSSGGNAAVDTDRSDDLRDAVTSWRAIWGSIDLIWLFNHQVLGGTGWCQRDGSVCFADEIEDYPRALDIFGDCQRLAAAFPQLSMDVAMWGAEPLLDQPLIDVPEGPWSRELRRKVSDPSVGFQIRKGEAKAIPGSDVRLFERFGLTIEGAPEIALRESRRCKRQAVRETALGDRGHELGLPDAVIHAWVTRARSLGLTGKPTPT